MIDIKNKIITAILIVILTMSMLASSGSGAEGDVEKVPTITMNINPVKSPTNIPTQIISGSGMASGCKGSGGISDLRVTVNGLAANIDASTNTFSRSISLVEGQNTITVIAQIGICSITKTTTIRLDTTPPPTGSISVSTNLSGATFSLTGASSYSGSGTSWSTANAPAGTYTITYGTVTGYNTPPSETKTLTAGGSIAFSGTYTRTSATTGNISVTTNLTGATFTLTGVSSYSGNGTSWSTANAPVGTYTITYGTVTGYNTPPSETLTLTAGGSIGFSGTYVPIADTPVSGLVAEWHFDGSAQDTSGSDNHGTINGAILVQGISGQALSFDGVDDMVVVPHSPSLSLEKYTMEAWINEFGETNGPAYILIKRYEPSWMDNYGLYIYQDGIVKAGSYSPDIWTWFDLGSVRKISAGKWYHIAATYDRTTLKIYINGVLDNSVNSQYKPYQNNYQLVIGRGCMGDPCIFRPSTPSFNGLIDEVRIYNRALSATEVMAEYNRINPPSKKCEGTSPYLYINDRTMDNGKTVEIPVMMCNAANLANMDIILNYDSSVIQVKDVIKGSLNTESIFDWNSVSPGKLKLSFANKNGASGSGSIAVLKFDVIGKTGAITLITGTVTTASKTDGEKISLTVNPGTFIVGASIIKGDCDGDNELTVREALAALQMSVEKRPVNICYDYNGDGSVDSLDAMDIMKAIVAKGV